MREGWREAAVGQPEAVALKNCCDSTSLSGIEIRVSAAVSGFDNRAPNHLLADDDWHAPDYLDAIRMGQDVERIHAQ
jgi:hypothetical protein